MGHELLVALIEADVRLLARVEGGARRRIEVDHAAAAVCGVVLSGHRHVGGVDPAVALGRGDLEIDTAADRPGARPPPGRPLRRRSELHERDRGKAEREPEAEWTRQGHQNQ